MTPSNVNREKTSGKDQKTKTFWRGKKISCEIGKLFLYIGKKLVEKIKNFS
jgi:hypothetical protein